jgi:hypothetical protein
VIVEGLFQLFDVVTLGDFEFGTPAGWHPEPRCFVTLTLPGSDLQRYWLGDRELPASPIRTDSRALFVAYHLPAEFSCMLQLGWPLPARALDACVLFKRLTNGRPMPCGPDGKRLGRKLIEALTYYGLPCLVHAEKKAYQELALRGGPYTPEEREALLAYCEGDVRGLALLLPKLLLDVEI